jgi:hypothetical protein
MIELWGWLAGIAFRVDEYMATGAVPEDMPAVAPVAGRRFRFTGATLDVTAGPLMATAEQVVVERGPNGERRETRTGGWTRALLSAQVTLLPRSLVRPFLALDGEVQLARAPEGVIESGLGNPDWMVGLALGATLGTP